MLATQFDRTKLLIGDASLDKLKSKKILLFGLGGVGGYVAEALVRTGVHHIDLVDKDVVEITNLNRQIISTNDTIGKNKTDVMRDRLLSINKDCEINIYNLFYLNNDNNEIDFQKYDYVIDCIDNITGKLSVIEECKKHNVKVISSMGSGNKTDPTKFKVADMYDTKVCPLAKIMRHELKNALINLKTSVQIDGNFEIKGNVNSLVQVINNMISNSIQAYGGKANQTIEFNIFKQDSNIIISIKDFAGGLPKEVSDKLFKEMVTTKGKNGTGLGLFMSYSNIRAHFNGNITVDSKLGVGTEFKISLPL